MARTELTGKQIKNQSVVLTEDVTGVLPVANGGSGSDTLPLNNVLLGNGSGALQAVAPGAAGYVLTSDGTTWISAAPTGASGSPVQGASGQRGSVWYQGAAAPGSIEGQLDGDYFLNTANGDVYQRQSGSWVLVANLTGPAGASGTPGASGADGASGAPGATGASGAKGDQGDPGPSGAPGADGASGPPGADGASGAAGADGSVLTSWQGEWDNYAEYGPGDIVSLGGSTWILDNHAGWTVGGAPPAYGWALFTAVGATGASGAPGADGATGASGAKGDQGDPGPSGSPGQDGASGVPGATGPAGADGASGGTGGTGAQGASGSPGQDGASGAPGADGASGQRGSLWYQGSTIPGSSGASGVAGEYDGDFYLHIPTGDVYELVGLSWLLVGSIKGVPGNDGASGGAGATGPVGATGATGGTGAPGASGAPGPSTVADDVLTVQNAADTTKQLRFSVAGVSAGTTRTLTVPDVNSTIEVTSRRGAANGYASLDASTKVPISQLPDGVAVDNVVLTGTSFQFYSGATAIGSPISLLVANLDGGTPSSTSTGYVDGGTL